MGQTRGVTAGKEAEGRGGWWGGGGVRKGVGGVEGGEGGPSTAGVRWVSENKEAGGERGGVTGQTRAQVGQCRQGGRGHWCRQGKQG